MKKHISAILIFALIFTGLGSGFGLDKSSAASEKEMRGVWVATVHGINYPSKKTTDPEVLKKDADRILDNSKSLGFNAIFLQVRPSSDSIYPSEIFPWSKHLTGTEGVAPKDGFDPLEYFVEGAHKRGLELHAWLNPYRVTTSSSDSITSKHPLYNSKLTVNSGGRLYLNPGLPEAQDLIADGAKEIVDNYDVDGIHIDDYFYPSTTFDDSAAYAKYGNGKSKADWRRLNTENTVKKLNNVSHDGGVQFGVSPFGIWANKSSNSLGSNTSGNQSYSVMYADTRKWVKDEILDYIAPQIYWNIGFKVAEYKTLVDWWCDVVKGTDVELYIGQGAYKCNPNEYKDGANWNASEIKNQINYHRSKSEVDGYVMYSYGSFMDVPALKDIMKQMNASDDIVFWDVVGHWAEEPVLYLADRGVVTGVGNKKFDPNGKIKRADYVLMLLRMLEIEAEPNLPNFDDVDSTKYYANAVATAKQLGLVNGIGKNKFAPEKSVTREDLFVMAYRALVELDMIKPSSSTSSLDKFTDKNSIADYAKLPIATLVDNGLVSGSKGKINPTGMASRAETSQVMYNIIQKLDI